MCTVAPRTFQWHRFATEFNRLPSANLLDKVDLVRATVNAQCIKALENMRAMRSTTLPSESVLVIVTVPTNRRSGLGHLLVPKHELSSSATNNELVRSASPNVKRTTSVPWNTVRHLPRQRVPHNRLPELSSPSASKTGNGQS